MTGSALLCADIGNSHTTVGLLEQGEVQAHWRVATDERRTAEALRQQITIREGDWYDADAVEKVITQLTETVGNLGYAFVEIRPRVRRTAASAPSAPTRWRPPSSPRRCGAHPAWTRRR